MNESVISATDLSLTFETNDGPVHALQDINLDIEKGEFVGSFIIHFSYIKMEMDPRQYLVQHELIGNHYSIDVVKNHQLRS